LKLGQEVYVIPSPASTLVFQLRVGRIYALLISFYKLTKKYNASYGSIKRRLCKR